MGSALPANALPASNISRVHLSFLPHPKLLLLHKYIQRKQVPSFLVWPREAKRQEGEGGTEMSAPKPRPSGRRHHRRHHCLGCHSCRYIRLVQHLIEKCLTFYMDRDDCVLVLAKHARIQPSVTIAVWDELMKENPVFFRCYSKSIHSGSDTSC